MGKEGRMEVEGRFRGKLEKGKLKFDGNLMKFLGISVGLAGV
jgi:hypothetical protein